MRMPTCLSAWLNTGKRVCCDCVCMCVCVRLEAMARWGWQGAWRMAGPGLLLARARITFCAMPQVQVTVFVVVHATVNAAVHIVVHVTVLVLVGG